MAKKNNIEGGETQDEKLQKQEVVVDVLNPAQEQTEQTDDQENQVSGESNEEFNKRIKTHIAELPKTQEQQKGESEEKDPKNTQTSKVEKKPHFIDAYKKAYPKEKLFYVTSDKQVFLAKDKHLAKFHQKGLKGGEIETIKVK